LSARGRAALVALCGTLACASAGVRTGGAPAPAGAAAPVRSLVAGGILRSYQLQAPASLEPGRTYPLLVGLHGFGSSGREFRGLLHPDSATSRAGFFAVYPDGVDGSWNIGCPACSPAAKKGIDDVGFVNALVDHLADSLPIDRDRVFLFGHSLGAQFTYHYACTSPRAPAGIASVGGLWLRRGASACRPAGDFPVLIIHGDRDRVLPFNGPRENISALSVPEALERWRELWGCDGDVVVEERPDATGDGTAVETRTATGCRGAGRLTVHRIRGGGHGWPGPVQPIVAFGPHSWNLDALGEVVRTFGGAAVTLR